jgi:mRNA-degrading endonuclease RelE of RelBE toxin-antitoxin system
MSEIVEFKKGFNSIYILKSVEKEIERLKDGRGKKRIVQFLYRLSERFPNKPEHWEKLEGEGCEGVFELKPKPYRLGCLVVDNNVLVIHLWRVQKDRSRVKSSEIGKACRKAEEVKDEFKEFIRRI